MWYSLSRALTLAAACGWAAGPTSAALAVTELPAGVWTGNLSSRTIPDVDKDGEWVEQIRVEHCAGQVGISFKSDDGWTEPMVLRVVPLVRQYLLVLVQTGGTESGRWTESQVWTLVDASPGRWTIAQSRAVLNLDMAPDAPGRTFRRLAWASLDFDPDGCGPLPEPVPDEDEPVARGAPSQQAQQAQQAHQAQQDRAEAPQSSAGSATATQALAASRWRVQVPTTRAQAHTHAQQTSP
jgi:hypothetical protein